MLRETFFNVATVNIFCDIMTYDFIRLWTMDELNDELPSREILNQRCASTFFSFLFQSFTIALFVSLSHQQAYLNFGSLLGLSLVPVFSQATLLVLDYKWSDNPPTYRRTVTVNYYWTHTVPKFGLQSSWITGACHYTRETYLYWPLKPTGNLATWYIGHEEEYGFLPPMLFC